MDPGAERLEAQGLGRPMKHISNSAAAYRGHPGLVFQILFLSFLVHFTTAAMYYYTALAIGAEGAEFWKVTFGSAIQIFVTVISPFTIAGEGIREAAQLVLLGELIGTHGRGVDDVVEETEVFGDCVEVGVVGDPCALGLRLPGDELRGQPLVNLPLKEIEDNESVGVGQADVVP